jgi:hypothetical protein
MPVNFDLAKLVGAASAPVALIIATSIFLSNLSGKYGALLAATHGRLAEFRQRAPDDQRRRLLTEQLRIDGQRLRTLIEATFWLGAAILLFIATVMVTAVSVVLPDASVWKVMTGASMFGGLLILALSVVLELRENHQSKFALLGDFAEFSELHAFDDPRTSREEVRDTALRAERSNPSAEHG